jgi:hypothetical protein
MASTPDKVVALLKNSKSPGEVFYALSQDPLLLIGIIAIVGLIIFFVRIYLWPQINPFKIHWIANFWDWLTSPLPPTPQERYPYAKVIFRTEA